MNEAFRIAWKELKLYLREDRLVLMLILPVVIVPLLMYAPLWLLERLEQGEVHRVAVKGIPPEIVSALERTGLILIPHDNPREAVRQKEASTGLVFAEGKFILYDRSHPLSQKESTATLQLKELLIAHRQQTVEARLKAEGLSPADLEPFSIETAKAASEREQALGLMALLIPTFIIFAVVGAGQSIALDATVGEKQMGTLEALLSIPIEPWKILLGKGLAVLAAALSTSIASLVGLAIGSWLEPRVQVSGSQLELGNLSLSIAGLGALFLTVGLFTTFSIGIVLSLGIFARSYREASTYLAPLDTLAIVPVMLFGFSEFFSPQTWQFALPGVGVVLALDGILKESITLQQLALTWLSTLGYTFGGLYWAYWSFRREETVFRN